MIVTHIEKYTTRDDTTVWRQIRKQNIVKEGINVFKSWRASHEVNSLAVVTIYSVLVLISYRSVMNAINYSLSILW